MKPWTVHRLAAFTDDPSGGNPAGVVLADALPDAADMQRIAAEVGYSETAFLARQADGRFRTRYFAPAAEVPFCGHATIAAGVLLASEFGPGRFELELNVGVVPVETGATPSGLMRATLTSVEPRVDPAPAVLVPETLVALGWDADDLDPSVPPVIGFAGSRHLVLAVRTRERLARLAYDFDDLRRVGAVHDLVTFQLVWRESPLLFHARNPFPMGGVVEDPATGAAAAALGAALRHLGLVEPPATIWIRQGEDMGRPSRLEVAIAPLSVDARIRVSGTAVPIQ